MFKRIFKEIKKYDSIVIARHIGVDPDAMASQVGLRDAILNTFPEKKVYAVGTGGGKFSFLGRLDHFDGDYSKTLLIVLDTPDRKRVDCADIEQFAYRIKIDHHPFMEEFCDIELVDDKASSACELVMRMIYDTKLEATKKVMETLYLGLVSDTNRFMFNNSTYTTFDIVSKVIKDYNLDISSLYSPLYMRPLAEMRLFGYMAESMQVTDYGVGYIEVSDSTLKKYGVDVASSGNMINNFNYIEEVLVWLAITEDTKNGIFKINIRSRGPVINTIAEKYNGGGHKLASGARVTEKEDALKLVNDLDEACRKYIEELGDINEN